MVPPAPKPNISIGHYRLANRIAVGGMAEVFKALWPQSAGADRAVVIKKMLPAVAADFECRAMFEEEAKLGLRIHHDNVVEVLDRGVDGDSPYLVLEYVFGVDLWRLTRWLMRIGQPMRPPLAMFVLTELLAGLDAVHGVRDERGIRLEVVHRDVSPSNVFLSVHGDVKLGDLGIARAEMRETHPQAPLGERAKGKLGYLAPEQVAGLPTDQRSDIFAAGVIAAELLMGRPLFSGGSEIAVLLSIRDGMIHPFREMVPKLPPGLGDEIIRALAKVPDQRTGSAAEMRVKLLPFVQGDAKALRRELGGLVADALAEGEDEGQVDRASLAKTVEAVAFFDQLTPARAPSRPPEGGPSRAFELDAPGSLPASVYLVQTADGKRLGPFTYARLVEQVTTGQVSSGDAVAIDDGPMQPLAQVAMLARHLPPSSRTPTMKRRVSIAATSETYDLAQGGVLAAITHAMLAKETGLLLCERDGVRKEVYFDQGRPAFVTSNLAAELLGEYLVSHDVLERSELDFALAVMPRFEGRLGDTLVALGLVEPVHLFRHIATSARDKLLDIFTWGEGHASLYRGVMPPESGFRLDIDVWNVLDVGLARRQALAMDRERYAAKAKSVVVRTDGAKRIDALGPPDDVRMVLEMLGAPRSLEEIKSAVGGSDPLRAERIVAILSSLDAVRWK